MRRRIFLFSALLAGLAVIVTSILVTIVAYDDFSAGIRREVIAESSYIREGYARAGDAYLNALEHRTGHRLTLISPGGAVLYDSAESPERMDNHLNRPEVQDALANGTGESTRYSDTIREQTYYYATRLEDGSVLRVSSTTASILASYNRIFWMVALVAGAVFLVAAFIASVITKRIVRPINNIDLEHPENNAAYEEIVPLLKRIREQRGQIDHQMRELDRGRREFAAITENMSEGFLVLDRAGKVLSYNKGAINILGARADASPGGNILALNRSEAFREVVQTALEGKVGEQIIELNGRRYQLFANPVMEGGSLQGVILLLLDVTEKQEREKLRREFTANVSHELKTPLTAISGYAEIMANGMAKSKDIPEFAQSIYREAQRLIALLSDLMLLSGLDENTQPVKGPVDLLALSGEAVRRLAPKAKEHEITLSVSGDPAEIQGIPSVLEEMVYNLLDNAIKYNRKGGSATVTVKKVDDTAALSVADTGIGIPKVEQERIFERFYRVDKSHNEAIPGTGLGLSIVKHGAMLHGAKIELVSGETGSDFTLSFPETQ